MTPQENRDKTACGGEPGEKGSTREASTKQLTVDNGGQLQD
eukprot:CAMPEP_0204561436 /NCGR_PEP_ID=MMETSP0661-20131031/33185_1 /ASSEMBLY_ACC=CAM_ASM_000606 /TAXON_ID=109239 /ORGANISM="Alexandrium margalefi, Strain AMGDE01CS-322" /LENGTH=40 /DNA_ID= /DNA_START= /DNA_END= /DNA_ORIENTATION=